MPLPQAALDFIQMQIDRIRAAKPKRIAFPEGDDPRVQAAAERLARERLLIPILVATKHTHPPPGAELVNPETSPDTPRYAALYYQRRKSKGVSEREAAELARRPLHFAKLMVAAGDADGSVGGAATSSAEAVRAALQCIGPAPGIETVSSVNILAIPNREFGHRGLLAFADCSIVIDPTSAQLADIAIATAGSTRTLLDAEPIVALLSFSTKGSAKHSEVDKVVAALKIVRSREPGLVIEGELQADAALVSAVGASKAPGSRVPGHANTLIFPNLNSANIGYKLVERFSGGISFGPLLQGLAKAGNDLSRGCTAEDIYNVAIITANQAEAKQKAVRQ